MTMTLVPTVLRRAPRHVGVLLSFATSRLFQSVMEYEKYVILSQPF